MMLNYIMECLLHDSLSVSAFPCIIDSQLDTDEKAGKTICSKQFI